VKYVIAAVAAELLAIFHVSVMQYIEILGVTPDLVLIFVAVWAVVRGHDEAFVVGLLAGFVKDLATSDPLGTSVLALTPLVLLAAAMRIRAVDTEFLPSVAVVALGSLGYGIISMIVLAGTGQSVAWSDSILRVVLPGCLVNALFTPVVYLPVHMFSAQRRVGTIGTRRLTSSL
jgi:rod shape-determining protein MreD